MKRFFFILAALIAGTVLYANATDAGKVKQGEWLHDLDNAKKLAAEMDRPLYVLFTGSDWCPPCKRLEESILNQNEFKEFAKDNLVLVYLDFPRRKQQAEDVKERNRALAREYKIEGFPTVAIMDAEGKVKRRNSGFGGESVDRHLRNYGLK